MAPLLWISPWLPFAILFLPWFYHGCSVANPFSSAYFMTTLTLFILKVASASFSTSFAALFSKLLPTPQLGLPSTLGFWFIVVCVLVYWLIFKNITLAIPILLPNDLACSLCCLHHSSLELLDVEWHQSNNNTKLSSGNSSDTVLPSPFLWWLNTTPNSLFPGLQWYHLDLSKCVSQVWPPASQSSLEFAYATTTIPCFDTSHLFDKHLLECNPVVNHLCPHRTSNA